MVPEAPLRQTKYGLMPDGEGWFVVNAREIRWRDWNRLGAYCDFEGKRRFLQLGVNISVLEPGQSLGRYHAENAQEGFLILAGRCLLIVEEQERELRAWDFVHCPPRTAHISSARARRRRWSSQSERGASAARGWVYPVSEVAARHRVSVAKETIKPAEAYADLPRPTRVAYQEGWLPDLR